MPLNSVDTTIHTIVNEHRNHETQADIPVICYVPPPIECNVAHVYPVVSTNNESLPTYDEIINPNAPPPSYDSLFGRFRESHKSAKSVYHFLKNILILLLGTVGCTLVLGIKIGVPVCMIVFGGLYLYDCPQGEYIPVYLLVAGGFSLFKQFCNLSAENEDGTVRQTPIQTLLDFLMLCWLILGSIWIYREYEPNYDPSLGVYCNKTLYLFAFWSVTSIYIAFAVLSTVIIVPIIFQFLYRRFS